ncbi:hypothetical protein X962_5769 [Burkholderia pseudomallei MSHR7343]|nr:hypothetical protein X962_5769 [Burkholderia pseudomallei MSHR7343]
MRISDGIARSQRHCGYLVNTGKVMPARRGPRGLCDRASCRGGYENGTALKLRCRRESRL